MKIGIVGGTGSFGKGLAFRWAKQHQIFIGSRLAEKGAQTAEEYEQELKKYGVSASLTGGSNQEAVSFGEIIVLAVKFENLAPLIQEAAQFQSKIIISPVVSLQKRKGFIYTPPAEGSVAQYIQKSLPGAAVIAGLHTIPANRLQNIGSPVAGDVPVCGDSQEAKAAVIDLVRQIDGLNSLDAGPLEVSSLVEAMVPLILNLKQYSLKKNTSIKFV